MKPIRESGPTAVAPRARVDEARHEPAWRSAADDTTGDEIAADTTFLHDISCELIGAGDEQALYEKLVDAAVAIMHSDFGSMQAFHRGAADGGELQLLASRGFSEAARAYWATVHVDSGSTCAMALRDASRVVAPDVRRHSAIAGGDQAMYRQLGVLSVQSTPLITRGGRIIGMLSTHWRSLHEPTELQWRLFDILARQAADLLERHQNEVALRERESWLAGQGEAMQAALDDAPLEASLGVLVHTVVQHLDDGARAAFYLVDAQGASLHHVVGMPPDYAQAVDGFLIGPESLACGLATHTGEAVLTTDVAQDPRWQPWRWLAERFGYRGCWSFPIRTAAGSVVGTFALYWPQPFTPSARHLALAEHITKTAALIISRHTEATERRRVAAALREADRRKDEFLAMLAHELRNPLAPIRNAVHVLRLGGGDPAIVNTALGMLDRQVGQMVRLIDDLLDVSRVSRGKIALRRERVDLRDVMEQAAEATRPLCARHGQTLEIALPPAPVDCDVDVARIVQLVGNLLVNASKFSEAGRHIRLSLREEAGEAAIRVSDDGIGIAPDQLPRVFELFAQLDTSLERTQGGLGIGLPLARKLAELHGGSLEARSDGIGKGSEFTVRLPLAARQAPVDAARHATATGQAARALRVLVVDDNRDSANSLTLLLRMDGHEVRTCNDGVDAIAETGRFRPDVVLLDIGLPGLDGYEVAQHIRAQAPGCRPRLVALTGWGTSADRERSAAAGFDAHLVKPVDYGALDRLLSTVE